MGAEHEIAKRVASTVGRRERDDASDPCTFSFLIYSRTPDHGIVPPTVRVGIPKLSHRHTQRHPFLGILNPIKLTGKTGPHKVPILRSQRHISKSARGETACVNPT